VLGLPPGFPRCHPLASLASAASGVRTMRALTPGRCHPTPRSPYVLRPPVPSFHRHPRYAPGHRFHRHGSVTHVLQTSPLCGRLVETARRIAFVLLRTEASLPVAPTPPRGDAVPFSYGGVAYSDTDLPRADQTPLEAHHTAPYGRAF